METEEPVVGRLVLFDGEYCKAIKWWGNQGIVFGIQTRTDKTGISDTWYEVVFIADPEQLPRRIHSSHLTML